MRTQQIIAEESGAADTIDPLGGAFAIESLTEEVEAGAMAYIEEVREMGDGSMRDGVLTGINEGFFQREIQEAAYEYQERVDEGEETVVGVNQYALDDDEEEEDIELLHVDEDATRKRQLDRLERTKEERDNDAVEAALADLDDAITSDENTVPYIIEAVKAYATMGEIMGVFEKHYGSYQETASIA